MKKSALKGLRPRRAVFDSLFRFIAIVTLVQDGRVQPSREEGVQIDPPPWRDRNQTMIERASEAVVAVVEVVVLLILPLAVLALMLGKGSAWMMRMFQMLGRCKSRERS